jgi:hypothetical protein
MPYTEQQIRRYYTKPGDVRQYSTITFSNVIAGKKYLLQSGPTGPFRPMNFLLPDGSYEEFLPVAASIPDSTVQKPTDTKLGQVVLARIGTQVRQYIQQIIQNATKTEDKTIEIRIALYDNPASAPIYERNLYAGIDGVTIDGENVTITLEFDNAAKVANNSFYDPEIFDGVING